MSNEELWCALQYRAMLHIHDLTPISRRSQRAEVDMIPKARDISGVSKCVVTLHTKRPLLLGYFAILKCILNEDVWEVILSSKETI